MRKLLVILGVLSVLAGACNGGDDDATGTPDRTPDQTTTTVASTEDRAVDACGDEEQPVPGTERLTVPGGDGAPEREVERVIPASYDGTTPHPLLVALHGFTSNIDQIDLFSGLPEAASSRGYVLLTPQALPATLPIGDTLIDASFWNVLPEQTAAVEGAQDDIGFLLGLIDDAVSDLCIDPDRVYVTGNSNGAGMSAALACASEDRIAAIAPVSGINLAGLCEDLDPVSVIAFHGDADPLVTYEGGSAASTELDAPAVLDQVGNFADAAGCDPAPAVSTPYDDIEVRRWEGCDPGIDIELNTILGGGHTWPGMLNYIDPARLTELADNQQLIELAEVDPLEVAGHMTTSIEATELMLDFFDDHTLPG